MDATKIALIESEPELGAQLAFLIENASDLKAEVCINLEKARVFLQSNPQVKLVVASAANLDTPAFVALRSDFRSITYILYLDSMESRIPEGCSDLGCALKENIGETIVHHFGKEMPAEPPVYCRIKTRLLIELSPLEADVYAKLSEKKYLKILRQSDEFNQFDVERYVEQKKLDFLYLKKSDCAALVMKLISKIERLPKHPTLPLTDMLAAHADTHFTVQEMIAQIGFTPELQKLVKAQVESSLGYMASKSALNKLLETLQAKEGKYLADHSFFLGHVACGIASHLEWSSKSTFLKLSLAAFMHDLGNLEERFQSCHNEADVRLSGGDDKAVENFLNHPKLGAHYARQLSEVPPDVDTIIMQHHEEPNGLGYPRKISASQIAPLSVIFIVAHDLVRQVLERKEQFDLNAYLNTAEASYTQSSFKKAIAACRQLAL